MAARVGVMTAACLAAVTLVSSGILRSRHAGPPLGFVPVAGYPLATRGLLLPELHDAGRQATVAGVLGAERGKASVSPSLGNFVLGAAAAAAAALAGRRRADRGGKVAMNYIVRSKYVPRWKQLNPKGMVPMIHRSTVRSIIQMSCAAWRKKYKKASDMEGIVQKYIVGNTRFQFGQKFFTDSEPWMKNQQGGGPLPGPDHHMDDYLYVRKFIEPAKFKKLEIVNWEMPENAMSVVSLQELMKAGVQYGHQSAVWNQRMLPYLYDAVDGTHIFDLVQTAAGLNRACYYCREAALRGATFMFVGTKEQAGPIMKAAALRCGQAYADQRFVGGTFTNHIYMRRNIEKMQKMREAQAQGAWELLTPKNREIKRNFLARMEKRYAGLEVLYPDPAIPDIMIMVDEVKEHNPVAEAVRLGIPIVGLIDSNNDPTFIDLPIPGNASGSRSIDLVIGKIADAISAGRALRNLEKPGDRQEIPKEWDPWLFSKDRIRWANRRRTKRQPWHKIMYGSYEQFKAANPKGRIRPVAPFQKFSWKENLNVV